MIRLRLLGSVDLRSADDRPVASVLGQPRRMALLAYLALAPRPGFRRKDTLLALFWPERDEASARHALRQSVYFLRRSLGDEVVLSRGGSELGVAPDRFWCDALALEEAVAGGRMDEAIDLYRGELLDGFFVAGAPAFERWLEEERARLRELAADAGWRLAEQRERAGDAAGGAHAGRWAMALSPADEMAIGRLIRLLVRLGDRAGAVRAYEAFAERLRDDYDLEPAPATTSLVESVRAEKERPRSTRRPHPAPAPEVPAMVTAADPLVGSPADPPPDPPGNPAPPRRRRRRRIMAAVIGVGVLGGVGTVVAAWPGEAKTAGSAAAPAGLDGAHDLYLQARIARAQRDGRGIVRAVELLERAVEIAPDNGPAHAGLGLAYAHLAAAAGIVDGQAPVPRDEALLLAHETAVRALLIDPALAEAHLARALYHHWHRWDWDAADRAYGDALRTGPDHSEVHHWYALFLIDRGRVRDALHVMSRARELDPLSIVIKRNLGYVLYCDRQWDAAIDVFRAVIELEPDWPLVHAWLRNALLKRGLPEDAYHAHRRHAELRGWSEAELDAMDRVYAEGGWPTVWRFVRDRALETHAAGRAGPTVLARLHAELGDLERAFAWLDGAVADRALEVLRLRADPIYDPLRGDPRYEALLERI